MWQKPLFVPACGLVLLLHEKYDPCFILSFSASCAMLDLELENKQFHMTVSCINRNSILGMAEAASHHKLNPA